MPKIVGYTTQHAMGAGPAQGDWASQAASAALEPLRQQIEDMVNQKMLIGGIAMTVGFIAVGALVYVRTER